MGYSLGQLALAWVIYNKNVSTAIMGARSIEQLEDSLKSLELYKKWTPELDQKVNKILNTTPDPKYNYATFTPGLPRRP
jgi:aryl-alcohol dehydrogenase-like predicted oxidoreductase